MAYDAAAEAIKVYEESFDSLSTTSTITAITKALKAAYAAGAGDKRRNVAANAKSWEEKIRAEGEARGLERAAVLIDAIAGCYGDDIRALKAVPRG